MSKNQIASVDVWYQYDGINQWAVSLCDSDGSEIRCDGGYDDCDEAWGCATELADDHGVEARELRTGTGEVVREYSPETAS